MRTPSDDFPMNETSECDDSHSQRLICLHMRSRANSTAGCMNTVIVNWQKCVNFQLLMPYRPCEVLCRNTIVDNARHWQN